MLSFEGVCSNPLGSWEQSVLLRSAYLYGSWYRFARTFFSNLLSIYFGSSGSKETQLAFLGFALSSPFSVVGIALGGDLRIHLILSFVWSFQWFDAMCGNLEEEQKSEGISFFAVDVPRFVKSDGCKDGERISEAFYLLLWTFSPMHAFLSSICFGLCLSVWEPVYGASCALLFRVPP